MRQLFLHICLAGLCVLGSLDFLHAQEPTTDPTTEEEDSSKLEIIFIQQYRAEEKPEGRFQELLGDVHLVQNNMHLWCDTGYIAPMKMITAFGNVQMLQDDSIRIFSDSLFYDGMSRLAQLKQEVVLQDSSMTIYTDILNYDLNTKIATYPTGALIVSDSAELVSKSGYYDANTNIAYFKDSVRVTHPDYKLVSDSLAFNTQTEKAMFIAPTYIYNEQKVIYCEDGYYDSKANYAELSKNAYYINEDPDKTEKATGDKIIYDGKAKMYYLIGNATFTDKDQKVNADTIVYDADIDQYFFNGNPKFRTTDSTQGQSIDAKNSFYDGETKTMQFRDSVRVVQDNSILTSDSLDYNRETRQGLARGNVVWEDTTSNIQITCAEAYYDDSTNTILAHKKPVLRTLIDGDSLWLSADTLYSMPDSNAKDNEDARILQAYRNVRLYKSDIQALCDSLSYSDLDSMFTFFDDPVLWVDSVQFTADTIRVRLKNNKINKVQQRKNSFIVSTDEGTYYNQIKGRHITASFDSLGKLKLMDVKHKGESVYYAKDGKDRFIGVNDIDCKHMYIYFYKNQLYRIKFVADPKAILYPMNQVNHQSLQLEGYRWLEEFRPKSKKELFKPIEILSDDEKAVENLKERLDEKVKEKDEK
ncbi:MAG: hypothetical protein GY810_08885 [Aureispira sp.]|nr:hypothetical protein [Aureispira sp.]